VRPQVAATFALSPYNYGIALMGRNQDSEAIGHFREALRISPGRIDVMNSLGIALMKCRQNEEAIACFTEVLRIAPGFAEAKQNLMIAVANQGRTPAGRM